MNPICAIYPNSYNTGDVMWAMELSWCGTVLPMLDEDSCLPVQRPRELLAVIEERPLTKRLAPHYLAHMTSGVNEQPFTGPISRMLSVRELDDENTGRCLPPDFEAWAKFLRGRREELIAISRKSIELDEPLDCSL